MVPGLGRAALPATPACIQPLALPWHAGICWICSCPGCCVRQDALANSSAWFSRPCRWGAHGWVPAAPGAALACCPTGALPGVSHMAGSIDLLAASNF